MIDGPKRFFEMRGAVFSNFQQAVGKCDSAFPTDAFQALTNRLRDCFRHAFSRKLGQLVRESVRFLVLDVEAHKGTILPSFSTLLLLQRQGERFSAHIRRYPLLAIFYSSDYSSMVELLNDFNHWLFSQLLDNRCELLVPAAETDHTYSHLENSPATGIAFTG